MSQKGLAIVQNFGVKENMVVNFAENISPVQKTIYGESFDVKVDKNPINIAYADGPLPFHMDLVYYEAPPGLQFLHCIKYCINIFYLFLN
jgi:gamma-butyrobetaine dioxygenase